MVRKISLLIALLTACGIMYAEYPTGYYDALVGKNQGNLKTATHDAIRSHTNISYGESGTWNAFRKTDIRIVDGKEYWWDMYSPNLVLVSSGHGSLNIEHSVANSWWDGTKNDAYNDIHHLNPSDSEANNRKSNYPLGKVSTVTYTNGVTTVGKPASASDYGGATYVSEPCDEYKGDFARVFMYMFTCYEDMNWGSRFTWMYNQGQKYPMFLPWAVNMLLEWNANDPVSQKEIARNDAVYDIQHNRNPFIDLPELADYIWGAKKNQLFTLTGGFPSTPVLTAPKANDVYDFGTRVKDSPSTLTIYVKGDNLTSGLSVGISGDEQFALGQTAISVADANRGTNISVNYFATAIGEALATLTLSGGGLESPVSITVKGEAVEKNILEAVTALAPDQVTESGYRALWTVPAVTPDYYIVSRTYKTGGEMKTRKYMTSEPYYTFTDRDFGTDERYSVQYAVGSDVSPASNEILVKAGSLDAPALFPDAIEVECVQGGVRISCGAMAWLSVVDVSGRTVVRVDNPVDGGFLPLSRGIYILNSSRLNRPLKIYVP